MGVLGLVCFGERSDSEIGDVLLNLQRILLTVALSTPVKGYNREGVVGEVRAGNINAEDLELGWSC